MALGNLAGNLVEECVGDIELDRLPGACAQPPKVGGVIELVSDAPSDAAPQVRPLLDERNGGLVIRRRFDVGHDCNVRQFHPLANQRAI